MLIYYVWYGLFDIKICDDVLDESLKWWRSLCILLKSYIKFFNERFVYGFL